MRIAAADLDKRSSYFLLSSVVVPRPIAWIGTRGAGSDNLAPFSFFMGVSARPPRVAVSIARGRRGVLKDTLVNLLETQVCTISLVDSAHLAAMHHSSAGFAPDTDEFTAVDVPKGQGHEVDAPYVADAPSILECRLVSAQDLGDVHLCVLEVVQFHVADRAWDAAAGMAQVAELDPVGRLGGTYATLGPEQRLPPAAV
jgi:flavin reductase (DIM6/NTAB) family NADH-FMN oxidoreductase RutF